MPIRVDPTRETHHPAQPQAGLAGRAQRDVGGRDVWRRLQRLNLPGGLTGRTGAHNVDLTHTEPRWAKWKIIKETN